VDEKKIDQNRLWCKTVKIYLDGVIESKTALMNIPYKDKCDCKHGNQLVPQDVFEEIMLKLSELELQAHIHSIGD
jgi:predicted amidohydrolase YtcJ